MFLNARYAPQTHWGDVALVLRDLPAGSSEVGSPEFWNEWQSRWIALGDRYEKLAHGSSTAAGRIRAERGAAVCHHWAEFMDFGDRERKLRLRSQVRDAFQCSLEGGELDVTYGELALDDASGCKVPYWLILPPAQLRGPEPVPCVILSNGLDSMTEVEVFALAESYLERGIAAMLFDGPGQGIHVGQVPLRIEMESVIAALIDLLREDRRIAEDRLAFVGVSFGGYSTLRLAQRLGSLVSCMVNLSGGPRVAPFDGLEDAEAARAGATGYGELAGYAATFDPAPETGRPPALRRAAELALADAGITPGEVDVVFADAAGVPELDRAEAQALRDLFGVRGVPVTAPKALTGRLFSGGGVLDVVAALMSIREDVIPATFGTNSVPEEYGIDLVVGDPRETRVDTALVLDRGRWGFNAATVIRAFEDGS